MYKIIYETKETKEWTEVKTLQEAEEFLNSIANKLYSFEIQTWETYCAADGLMIFNEEQTKHEIHFLILGAEK